jgi:electron transfer flavoprotein-quinone oxidoreductase
MFTAYPEMAVGIAKELFTVTGKAPVPLRNTVLQHAKRVGFMNLIKDGIKGVTAI